MSAPPGRIRVVLFMPDISYHGDILSSPDTRVNLMVIYPDGNMDYMFSHHGGPISLTFWRTFSNRGSQKRPNIPCSCRLDWKAIQISPTLAQAKAERSHTVFLWTWRTARKQQGAEEMMPALTRVLTFPSASFLQSLLLPRGPHVATQSFCLSLSWFTAHYRNLFMRGALPRHAARHEG